MPTYGYTLSSPPPGKILAGVGPFRNVNNVSLVTPGDASLRRANVGTAGITQGSSTSMAILQSKIIG